MKKLIAVAAMSILAGATVGQAQTITTTVTNGVTIARGPINLNVKVRLNGATKLKSPTVAGLQWAEVQVPISAFVTDTVDVFGTYAPRNVRNKSYVIDQREDRDLRSVAMSWVCDHYALLATLRGSAPRVRSNGGGQIVSIWKMATP